MTFFTCLRAPDTHQRSLMPANSTNTRWCPMTDDDACRQHRRHLPTPPTHADPSKSLQSVVVPKHLWTPSNAHSALQNPVEPCQHLMVLADLYWLPPQSLRMLTILADLWWLLPSPANTPGWLLKKFYELYVETTSADIVWCTIFIIKHYFII